MKIIIENKKDEIFCCVLDTAKAIAIRVESFDDKSKIISITYENNVFSYTENSYNFYSITHTMDGRAHKNKVNIDEILADFSLSIR